ncbi:Sec2p-domain-containing protein [Morchella conica CCBAS932]|uniref:Sec2p-domain-containing protein n=1 Tax=Morchella conica CCBAS932 TaxID=1392247 RepID=A0A3N4KUL9_9PEZI|nr:Sec2p-domain-containing protein [Morchella conica CCBAS932]
MTTDRPGLFKTASESALRNSSTTTTTAEEQQQQTGDSTNGDQNLNKEVAALSNKLISAINHQTQLDDSLATTKHELELSKAKIRQLEAVAKKHEEMMSKGLLVEKKDVDAEAAQLMNRLKEERTQRGKAEKDKRNIEQELETLTTALFDEANKMVSAARKERDAMDKKNEQLRAQLADTEMLLASHQEQLAELKLVMQQMTADREESEIDMSTGTPSTPALNNRASKESFARMFESLHLSPNNMTPEEMTPCPPTSLSGLLHPVLRYDTGAYQDFCEVMHAPKVVPKTSPMPRLSSGSFSSIQVMGMGIPGYSSSPSGSPTGLTGGLFGSKNKDKDADSRPSSPSSNAPTNSNGAQGQQQTGLGLKETKFYKRVLVEDIEPTLRLDNAPGLSWLARRNVLSAITDGNLVIDPIPSTSILNTFSCTLCGEVRPGEEHARTHRMRTSEAPNAQRYPLCGYCVVRTRAVCDFLAFLRTLKEGLWKCESEGDEKHAWDESVKLRERMFWSRIGGGVIPAFIHNRDSARNSEEQERSRRGESPMSDAQDGQVKLDVPKKRSSRDASHFAKHDRMPSVTEDKVMLSVPYDSAPSRTSQDSDRTEASCASVIVTPQVRRYESSEADDTSSIQSSDRFSDSVDDIDEDRDTRRDTITAAINSPLPQDDETFETPLPTPRFDQEKHAVPGAW